MTFHASHSVAAVNASRLKKYRREQESFYRRMRDKLGMPSDITQRETLLLGAVRVADVKGLELKDDCLVAIKKASGRTESLAVKIKAIRLAVFSHCVSRSSPL